MLTSVLIEWSWCRLWSWSRLWLLFHFFCLGVVGLDAVDAVALDAQRLHLAALLSAHSPRPGLDPCARHGAPHARLDPEAHPVPRAGPHERERRWLPAHAGIHGQGGRLLLHRVRVMKLGPPPMMWFIIQRLTRKRIKIKKIKAKESTNNFLHLFNFILLT